MKKVIEWLKAGDRWKHVAGGLILGMASDGWWCAALTSVTAALCLEYKDKSSGGSWDWTDWALTVGGAAAGLAIRIGVLGFLRILR